MLTKQKNVLSIMNSIWTQKAYLKKQTIDLLSFPDKSPGIKTITNQGMTLINKYNCSLADRKQSLHRFVRKK